MAKTLPMSRFIRHYRQHLVEAEQTDEVIVLQQRAGRPGWVLQTEDRVRANAESAEFLSAALVAVAGDDALTDRFTTALAEVLPWMVLLPAADRATFVTEAVDALRTCASGGKLTAFAALIEDWCRTAEVWSDPALAASLATGVADPLGQSVCRMNSGRG